MTYPPRTMTVTVTNDYLAVQIFWHAGEGRYHALPAYRFVYWQNVLGTIADITNRYPDTTVSIRQL